MAITKRVANVGRKMNMPWASKMNPRAKLGSSDITLGGAMGALRKATPVTKSQAIGTAFPKLRGKKLKTIYQ